MGCPQRREPEPEHGRAQRVALDLQQLPAFLCLRRFCNWLGFGPRHGPWIATVGFGRARLCILERADWRGPLPIPSTSSEANGFPTFADTQWGDPIAMAPAEAARDDSRSKSGDEDEDAESGKKCRRVVGTGGTG